MPTSAQIKSSVWLEGNVRAWPVAETPSEVAERVCEGVLGQSPLIELTLANRDERWNGRTVYLKPHKVTEVAPPLDDLDWYIGEDE